MWIKHTRTGSYGRWGDDIVDRSVGDGDMGDGLLVETIRQKIRDEFIADATVTIVLIGSCTWQRKHVDWEIGSSLRSTTNNSRCGLLGILLPTHPNYKTEEYNIHLVPPRLADNCRGKDPYALVHRWLGPTSNVREWVHRAFVRRDGMPPHNGRIQFRKNRSGDCSHGWQD